ncbi:MAG: AMP-binding protein, partial [Verrucomicrobia bacterium]|nr:AMP-binding protein [Verrucomicrobiota bacterium]
MRRTSRVPSSPLTVPSGSLASVLERNTRLHGSRPALLAADRDALTHGQLWDHVAQGVRDLNHLGLGRGDRVALALPQGADLALAFLTVAAGATAVPLNPASSASEFERLFQDLRPRALILAAGDASEARRVADASGVPVLDLTPGTEPGSPPRWTGTRQALKGAGGFAGADDVALVLYTSGTTARPKRVPLTHANLLASLHAIGETLQLGPDDRCLNVMPLFHIHGLVACLLASLGAGGSTACTGAFDPARFTADLDRWKPTWYSAVPTIHQAILSRTDTAAGSRVPSSLRLIRSSSAALPPPVMERLEAVFGVPVLEAYGMTEAAHQMACNPLPPRVRKPGSVGLAAGPEVAVLGASGERLPAGVHGEVGIRGPNVTRGYENLPEGAPDGFTHGWFRTGDQGFLDADGYLFLTGRLKELINRGGEKIAPREVDEVLLHCPGVAQAVAFAVPHASLGEDVAAAVVPRPGADLQEAAVREFAFEHLPAFKIPSRILIVDQLPV